MEDRLGKVEERPPKVNKSQQTCIGLYRTCSSDGYEIMHSENSPGVASQAVWSCSCPQPLDRYRGAVAVIVYLKRPASPVRVTQSTIPLWSTVWRFAQEHLAAVRRRELKNCIQKSGEGLNDFPADIPLPNQERIWALILNLWRVLHWRASLMGSRNRESSH